MALEKRDELTTAVFEQVVSTGDLSRLTPGQRLHYVAEVCEQLGLNPLTSGFQYITFEGKMQMYASRQTAAQLGANRKLDVRVEYDVPTAPGLFLVKGIATDGTRTVDDIGAVDLTGLKGKALENGVMKAITKAKRRAVLGFTGMGILDESEIENLTGAVVVEMDPATGEIKQPSDSPRQLNTSRPTTRAGWQRMYEEREAGGAKPETLARIIEAAGAEGFEIAVTAEHSEPEPVDAPPLPETPPSEPVSDAPVDRLTAWAESHGCAWDDIGDVLKMPWDEWVKLIGDQDAALDRAKFACALAWDIEIAE